MSIDIMGTGCKGCVAVSMLLDDARACFICTHLHAHTQYADRRDEELTLISKSLVFRPSTPAEYARENAGRGGMFDHRWVDVPHPLGTATKLQDHEFVWAFGDMNYRIEADPAIAAQWAASGEFEKLKEHEQLLRRRVSTRMQHPLALYQEAPLTFKPTYKYVFKRGGGKKEEGKEEGKKPSGSEYKLSKGRTPSWTDRVLWYEAADQPTGQAIRCLRFGPNSCGVGSALRSVLRKPPSAPLVSLWVPVGSPPLVVPEGTIKGELELPRAAPPW